MSDGRNRQLADTQLDQSGPVLLQDSNQVRQRGELLIECEALDQLLTLRHGPEWERTRICESGHGTFTEGAITEATSWLIVDQDALVRRIVGR